MNFIKKGLYSEDHLLLHTVESLVSSDRIFVGNQPDEFAIAGLLEKSKRVLMLGLGFGESLRPILAGNHDLQITAVDINASTLNACYSINENYFPLLNSKVNYINEDAFKYIYSYSGVEYDCICVDLYTKEGYPLQILDDDFWRSLKKILTADGTVIFNSWGLPQQLNPFHGDTIQVSIARRLLIHFEYNGYLPHRRNITFIANKKSKPKFRENIDYTHLNEVDRLILEFYPYRLRNILPLDIKLISKVESEENCINKMEQFNDEMFKRWPNLVNKCNEVMISLGFPKIISLSDIYKDPHLAKILTRNFLENKHIESVTIPILAASNAFENSGNLDWYLEWLVHDKEELLLNHKEWFINTAIWQLLSIAANPFSKYDYWVQDIEEILSVLSEKSVV
ncbi:spermidine synthase [Sutcliffiella horikoshii]|uniref:spermidine synthase n=1 Tax=Sutcliffiella horikoshii TaxID=79883 RepID=UPI003CF91FDF